METIGEQRIWTFLGKGGKGTSASCTQVRKAPACPVKSYMDLATKIAELQFMNRDFMLTFRGQKADILNRSRNTSLKPGLMRAKEQGELPGPGTLMRRFQDLERCEAELVRQYQRKKLIGRERLERQQILRWSILQHYEVCRTPLLDVSSSLRIAASFASHGAEEEAFIFVLGVPNLSGAITASAEAGLQIIRLSSVCPPSALRPHIQEGYLLGEYPDMKGYDQKQLYQHFEIDFGRRLIAKFRIKPRTFWQDPLFPQISSKALYPDENDPLYEMATKIKARIRIGD